MSRINEHLVATECLSNSKFRVLNLPARKLDRVIEIPRFDTLDQAEQYIQEHFPSDVIVVHPFDMAAELEQRRAGNSHLIEQRG